MQKLLKEYKESLKAARKLKDQAPEADKKILSRMVSDLEFVVQWMEKGRMPGAKRAIDRRSVYQRTVFYDPVVLSQVYGNRDSYNPFEEDEEESKQLDPMVFLEQCTAREVEVFLMHKGQGLSMQKTADMLGVSKSAVQETIKRAKKKIDTALQAM